MAVARRAELTVVAAGAKRKRQQDGIARLDFGDLGADRADISGACLILISAHLQVINSIENGTFMTQNTRVWGYRKPWGAIWRCSAAEVCMADAGSYHFHDGFIFSRLRYLHVFQHPLSFPTLRRVRDDGLCEMDLGCHGRKMGFLEIIFAGTDASLDQRGGKA